MLCLIGVSLLISANAHGEPRKNENFFTSLISAALSIGLLIWGGFFS